MIDDIVQQMLSSDEFWRGIGENFNVPFIAYPVALFVTAMIDNRRRARKTEERVQAARVLQKLEDKAEQEEIKGIEKHVDTRLAMIESTVYEGVEAFVYNNANPQRRLTIKRNYTSISIPAETYLRDYHGAIKSVLFKVVDDYWVDEMNSKGCATVFPEENVFSAMVLDLRTKILTETHKKSGSNEDIKAVENDVLPFETLQEFAKNTIIFYQHLRADKLKKVERYNSENKVNFWGKRQERSK